MKNTKQLFITLLEAIENPLDEDELERLTEEMIDALKENETEAEKWCKLQTSLNDSMMPKLWDAGRVM